MPSSPIYSCPTVVQPPLERRRNFLAFCRNCRAQFIVARGEVRFVQQRPFVRAREDSPCIELCHRLTTQEDSAYEQFGE